MLEKPQIANWAAALVGRWDDNATPDFFVPIDESQRWLAVTAEGELSPDGPFSVVEAGDAPLRFSGPQDVNGDGLDELFVSWPARTNVVLEARNDGNVTMRRRVPGGNITANSALAIGTIRLTSVIGKPTLPFALLFSAVWRRTKSLNCPREP